MRKIFLWVVFLAFIASCGGVRTLKDKNTGVSVALPSKKKKQTIIRDSTKAPGVPDQVVSFKETSDSFDSKEAEFDEDLGENITSVQMDEVTVAATNRRNLAERAGKISLEFVVTVPSSIQREDWRVDIIPIMMKGPDTASLKEIVYTGKKFKEMQDKDYGKYSRYESKIVSDTADFYDHFVKKDKFKQELNEIENQKDQTIKETESFDSIMDIESNAKKTYRDKMYEISVRNLAQQAKKNAKQIKKKTKSVDESDPYAYLDDYMTPKYTFGGKAVIQKDAVYNKKGNKNDNQDAVDPYDAVFSETPKHLKDEALIKKSAEQIQKALGFVPEAHKSALNVLSDSTKFARFDLNKKMVETKVRLLEGMDSAVVVNKFVDYKKVEQNQLKIANKDKVFAKTVKIPYVANTKLDSVVEGRGVKRYYYTEIVPADEYTSKIYICINGEVMDMKGDVYKMPHTDTLIYSVSSMTAFLDERPRYVQQIITRDAEANARFFFVFPKGKSNLDRDKDENVNELAKVRKLTRDLMTDPVFIIDSITLRATSSPEGSWNKNERLASERAYELKKVMDSEFRLMRDSLRIDMAYTVDNQGRTTKTTVASDLPDLPSLLRADWLAEDWSKLEELVLDDEKIGSRAKEGIMEIIQTEKDPDSREVKIRRAFPKDYAYMLENIYPQMRAVDFRFNLHRRGMLLDTVYTTVLDSAYINGMELLRKRKYASALEILRDYNDQNTAVAYMSLGYDKAALRIFKALPETADVDYLLSILTARMKNEDEAVAYLKKAVKLKATLRFRGNLDPEISALIAKYHLFEEDDEDIM